MLWKKNVDALLSQAGLVLSMVEHISSGSEANLGIREFLVNIDETRECCDSNTQKHSLLCSKCIALVKPIELISIEGIANLLPNG